MGFNNRYSLKHFLAFDLLISLFAFIVVVSFNSCPASCNEIFSPKKTPPSDYQPAAAYQVLRIKNTTPFFVLNKQEFDKKRRNKRKILNRRSRTRMDRSFKTGPFSAMLPKGFVPPSGSSPCHNDKPDSSVSLFCGLSTTAKP